MTGQNHRTRHGRRGAVIESARPMSSGVQAVGGRHRGRILRGTARDPALQHTLGHVLADEGEGVVVAPVAVDADEATAQALVAEAQLLDDAKARARFSGRMQISMRCSRSSEKQMSVARATAVGVMPRPANRSLTQ